MAKQFQQLIRTSTSADVTVTTETETFSNAVGVDDPTGANYPHRVDPEGDIREIIVTESGAEIRIHCTAPDGSDWYVPLKGGTGVFDQWRLDWIEFRDPSGSGDPISAIVSHE